MPCKNCSADKTIKAHLIPQAFAREVRGEGKVMALTNGDLSSFQPSQNGRYDDGILCAECDNLLGKDEKYAFEILAKVRGALRDRTSHQIIEGLEGDRLFRCATGIAWKFALTRDHYGRIDIGPYADALKNLLFDRSKAVAHVDAFMMRFHDGTSEARFFRAPKTERYNSVNFIRLGVGGFVFLIKIDKRPLPEIPREVWLRGNKEVLVPLMPANFLEEGKLLQNVEGKNEKLALFLERVALSE
ncbi:hypothetical protein ACLBKT_07505 [Erythrobacter sp. W302b]|uniref:hypothetical protein n=1 Tax=Erythrobacter sp. W302b TaxID=3389874 RepID=UPI00396B0D85